MSAGPAGATGVSVSGRTAAAGGYRGRIVTLSTRARDCFVRSPRLRCRWVGVVGTRVTRDKPGGESPFAMVDRMAKTLVIAEKPSVGRDIAAALPGSFAREEGYLESDERRQQCRTSLEVAAERGGVDTPLALGALNHGRLSDVADVDRLDRHLGGLLSGDAKGGEPPLVSDPMRVAFGRYDD